MPIKMLWGNPTKTVLHQIYMETFDLSEWYEAISQTCIMLNQVRHPVNMILDLQAVDHIPMDWIEVLSHSKSNYHVNQSRQVVVVKPAHVRPLKTLLKRSDNIYNMSIVSSRDEARQLLAQSSQAAVAN